MTSPRRSLPPPWPSWAGMECSSWAGAAAPARNTSPCCAGSWRASPGIVCPAPSPPPVCSGTRTVPIDRVRVIGERINPTGKKRFQQALREGDMDYVLSQALAQTQAGADILDVNVGLPDLDEVRLLPETVRALQAVTDAPLQLDSTQPAALEAALRVYCGKPIVNSVNGDPESLDIILPLVKKVRRRSGGAHPGQERHPKNGGGAAGPSPGVSWMPPWRTAFPGRMCISTA